jgi:hypothetical protein
VTRCVRRSFLCGFDQLTGRSFDHRRGWVVARMKELGAIFAVRVLAFSAMSNHLHLALQFDAEWVEAWSDREVAERWNRLYQREPRVALGSSRSDALFGVQRPAQVNRFAASPALLPARVQLGAPIASAGLTGAPSCTRVVAQRRAFRRAMDRAGQPIPGVACAVARDNSRLRTVASQSLDPLTER